MSSVSRSVRNVFRNKVRTLVVILIIGLSIGVFLSMSIVNANIAEQTISLAENIDTTITIRPAGSYGFFSTDTLNDSMLSVVESTEHVASIQRLIMQIELMSGWRKGSLIQGMDPDQDLILYGGGVISITSGRTLNSSDAGELVAVIGTAYSDETGANVGTHISLNGTSLEVVGEFSAGNMFSDMSVIVPYETAKSIYAIDGISMVYVTVDSIGYMDPVMEDLKNNLGSDYDVVPLSSVMEDRAASLQESITSIAANSELGSLVSLVTAAVVMIFVMILVTRERTREIGVLKAVGFKNSKIMTQFLMESMTLAAIGFVIGVLLAVLAGPYIANVFLGVSTTSGTTGMGMGGRDSSGQNLITTMDFTLSSELMLYTLILTMVLGIIGSLYPVMKAIKLKPAEALRYE